MSYTDKSEFDEITHFLSNSNNVKSEVCFDDNGDSREINIHTSATDEFAEGQWETRDRRKISVSLLSILTL